MYNSRLTYATKLLLGVLLLGLIACLACNSQIRSDQLSQRVEMPSPDELVATLKHLGYEESARAWTGPDAGVDADAVPDIPPWDDENPNLDVDPNTSRPAPPTAQETTLSWRWGMRKPAGEPVDDDDIDAHVDGPDADADALIVTWSLSHYEPKRTESAVIKVSCEKRGDDAVRIATAIAPALGKAVRTAIGEQARTGKQAVRTVGDVRVEIGEETWALRHLGLTVPFLIRAMETECGVLDAPQHLTAIGEPAVPHLLRALNDPRQHRRVRAGAAAALGPLPSKGSQTALVKALTDQDRWVRAAAAEALWHQPTGAAVPALVKATGDGSPGVRSAAIRALRHAGGQDKAVVDALIRVLKDEHDEPRRLAAMVLGSLGPHAKAALPALRAQLAGATGWYRLALAESLWTVGRDVETVVPALLAETTEAAGGSKTNLEARRLLKNIGEAGVPALQRALTSGDPQIRKAAETVLKDIQR